MDWKAPRVLVIALEPSLRFTLAELLRAYGYEVATAATRAAALRLEAEAPFDATLLDSMILSMPVAEALRQPN